MRTFILAAVLALSLAINLAKAESNYSNSMNKIFNTLKESGISSKKASYINKEQLYFQRRAANLAEYNIDPAKYGYTFKSNQGYSFKAGVARSSSSGAAAGVNFGIRW